MENIKFCSRTAKLMQTMLKHIFWPIIDCFSLILYALPELHAFKVLFYAESVGVVTSGHVTKVAVTPFDPQLPKTHCYTQTSPLYHFWNQSYCRLKFYTAGIGNFAYFCKKIEEILYFPSYRKIDADDAERLFLTYYWLFWLVSYRSYTHSVLFWWWWWWWWCAMI